jgi:hypothetical protein
MRRSNLTNNILVGYMKGGDDGRLLQNKELKGKWDIFHGHKRIAVEPVRV